MMKPLPDLWKDMTESAPTRTELASMASGCAAFTVTCGFSTLLQKGLGVSTGTGPPLPTMLGLATVCVASVASQEAAIYSHQHLSNAKVRRREPSASDNYQIGSFLQVPKQTARLCLLGLVTFSALGGRYWGIAPSSITNLGSFARFSIPAKEAYATPKQRTMIEQMGRRYGCHTCGSRRMVFFDRSKNYKFIGDHMPPKSVAEQWNQSRWRKLPIIGRPVQFRFYAQCEPCSLKQGKILGKAQSRISRSLPTSVRGDKLQEAGGTRAKSYFHGWKPRINHLTGGVLGGMTVVGASDSEIAAGNPDRYLELERTIVRATRSTTDRIEGFFKGITR